MQTEEVGQQNAVKAEDAYITHILQSPHAHGICTLRFIAQLHSTLESSKARQAEQEAAVQLQLATVQAALDHASELLQSTMQVRAACCLLLGKSMREGSTMVKQGLNASKGIGTAKSTRQSAYGMG
eukprot:1157482-Pelagomonas_calceolata.AAC.4